MKRVLVTAQRDLRLLLRNGFVYAAALMVVFLVVILRLLPEAMAQWFLPLALFGNFVTNGFYFAAGMLLLERAERTLNGQFVTPLRPAEYIIARMLSLAALTVVETTLILLLSGAGFGFQALVAALMLTAVMCLIGLLMVTRYDSVNRFLMPSVVVTLVAALPLADLLDFWHGLWWFAHPLHPFILLLNGAFGSISAGLTLVALLLSLGWVALGLHLTRHVLHRFAVRP